MVDMDSQKTIVVDLDGCLTNGKQYITADGKKLFKAFCSRDVAATREFILHGWRVIIVSADDDPSGSFWAHKIGAEFMHMRDKRQSPRATVAVGDSCWDVSMLELATIKYCPADAASYVKAMAGMHILETCGGDGIMAEIVDIILYDHGRSISTWSGKHLQQPGVADFAKKP